MRNAFETEEIADTRKITLLSVSRHTLKLSSFLTSLNLRPAFILYFISFHTTPFSSLIALILHSSLSLSFTSLSLHLVLLFVSCICFYSLTFFIPHFSLLITLVILPTCYPAFLVSCTLFLSLIGILSFILFSLSFPYLLLYVILHPSSPSSTHSLCSLSPAVTIPHFIILYPSLSHIFAIPQPCSLP